MKGGDPAIFVAGSILIAAVACAAGLIPAIRATRIDPMTAPRNEFYPAVVASAWLLRYARRLYCRKRAHAVESRWPDALEEPRLRSGGHGAEEDLTAKAVRPAFSI